MNIYVFARKAMKIYSLKMLYVGYHFVTSFTVKTRFYIPRSCALMHTQPDSLTHTLMHTHIHTYPQACTHA